MEWRPAWARAWAEIRFCSDACRKHGLSEDDRRLESAILTLLSQRARDQTICPSEASRQIFGDVEGLEATAMERTRQAARRLVAANKIQVLQHRQVVDATTAKGPIRLRLRA